MGYFKLSIIVVLSLFLFSAIYIETSFAQVISSGLEESVLYSNLSKIIEGTAQDLNDLGKYIKSGEKDNALNILSNVTLNINEVKQALDLLVTNPIYGGD